jgi:hypothetical protein
MTVIAAAIKSISPKFETRLSGESASVPSHSLILSVIYFEGMNSIKAIDFMYFKNASVFAGYRIFHC